jgi:hypothetical protein
MEPADFLLFRSRPFLPIPVAERQSEILAKGNAIQTLTRKMYKYLQLLFHVVFMLGLLRVIRWRMYIWLPHYLTKVVNDSPYRGVRHIVFVFADHYEPNQGERGAGISSRWLESFLGVASKHRDSYGRRPLHTWFYPYDQHNELVMPGLVQAVRDGYGEIEFHLHHSHDTDETFTKKISDGLDWFNRFGAQIDCQGNRSFGFVHGNWSLANSRGSQFCGVTRELEILKKAGCYADFTFPAFGDLGQPRKVNSIYYARENGRPKSYDWGTDARVGTRNAEDLLIFQGALNLTDYSAVEVFNVPTPAKIDSWVESNIHVEGRPEWVFVKVHTHGTQSQAIFGAEVDQMFSHLETKYGAGQYRLHYATAREAYNLVRAAEDGKEGDPNDYLDYAIAPPLNKTNDIAFGS